MPQKPSLNIGTKLVQSTSSTSCMEPAPYHNSEKVEDIGSFAKGGDIKGIRKNKLQWKFPSTGKSGGSGGTGPLTKGRANRGGTSGKKPGGREHSYLKPVSMTGKRKLGTKSKGANF